MKSPSASQQRFFGLAMATALMMVGWICYRTFGSISPAGLCGVLGVGFCLVYYGFPASQPKCIAWFGAITFPIRWVVTLVVLAVVYYCVVTPIAIWYRLSGKSIRQSSPDASSNWTPLQLPSDPDSYFKTY